VKPAPRRRFIVVLVLAPFVALALIEGALRAFGVGVPDASPPSAFMNLEGARADEDEGPIVRDPVLFWRLRPEWTGGSDRFGRTGFRTEFATQKSVGVVRVACVGDSNTYGLALTSDRAWPAVLQRVLAPASDGSRVEVLNLGVPGYTSWQERRLVETELAPFAPDVVTVEAGAFNEWAPAIGAIDRDQGRRPWWRGLHVVALLEPIARAKTPRLSVEEAKSRLADLRGRPTDGPVRVPLADFEDDLVAIADWCGRCGARVVFVAHPLPATTVEAGPLSRRYADAVRRVARRVGAPLADGWAAFAASGRGDDELFFDFCHPTALGHEIMAAAVRQAIERPR